MGTAREGDSKGQPSAISRQLTARAERLEELVAEVVGGLGSVLVDHAEAQLSRLITDQIVPAN